MNCAICAGTDVKVVLDMGDMALAGAFLKPYQFADEKVYPLRVGFCRTCRMLQVLDRIGQEQLFGRYFYRSSVPESTRLHFERYAEELVERFLPGTVVEIGCNDGVMLRPLAARVETVIGVDPSDAARELRIPRVAIWRSYFSAQAARQIGKADLIVANNVLAHVENIHEVLRGVREMLEPGGVLAMECHYAGSVLAGQYDAIYHEHVFYYSLASLEYLCRLWGLQVFDVAPQPVHGGSMRFYIGHVGKHDVAEAVRTLREQERANGFYEESTYVALGLRALDHRRQLMGLLNRLKRERWEIAAYGAAGRANTLLQWCGVEGLAYVVDDCEAKHGYYTPGTHVEIRPTAALQTDPPDCVLVSAWTYYDEIAPKCGDLPLIVPMPTPHMLAGNVLEAA